MEILNVDKEKIVLSLINTFNNYNFLIGNYRLNLKVKKTYERLAKLILKELKTNKSTIEDRKKIINRVLKSKNKHLYSFIKDGYGWGNENLNEIVNISNMLTTIKNFPDYNIINILEESIKNLYYNENTIIITVPHILNFDTIVKFLLEQKYLIELCSYIYSKDKNKNYELKIIKQEEE